MNANKLMMVILLMAALLGGCANQETRQNEYVNYLNANLELAKLMKDAKPIASYEGTDSGGKSFKWEVNLPVQLPAVQQIKTDEAYAFWGQVLSATVPTVGNAFTAWSSHHYGYLNQKAMWGALGGSLGGGIRVDSGGGNVGLYGSGNSYRLEGDNGAEIQMTGFGFGYGQDEAQLEFGGQEAQEEGPTAQESYNPTTTTTTTTTQTKE